MRGKNGPRPRGPSIGNESMTTLFNDDPLMHGLALFGNGGQLGLLSHTPPNFTPGSYEVSHMKRARAGSISGRLRSASDLEEKGLIDKSQKGVLKDLIISGDSELQAALDLYDNGDASQLEALMDNGLLDRRESFDLLDNLDFGIMELGMSDEEQTANSVTVDPVLMPVGADHKSGVPGGEQAKVSPPPLPITTAATAAAADKSGSAASSSASALRNSGTVDGGTTARGSPVEGGGKDSAQGGVGSGIQGGAGVAGGSGAHPSEQELDLAGEGSGHFDIGEMAFDATFDHEYGEQEDEEGDNDVHMKDGSGQMPPSSSASASAGAAGAAAVVSTAVGPLRVVGSTSKNKLAPPNLISSRGSHRRDDNVGSDDARRPAAGEQDGSEDDGEGDDEDESETDDSDSEGSQDAGGGGGGGVGVVMSDDEGGGREGHGVDSDAPELGSFSTMGAVIGDFSPQFKFSFTDDIHLDLGGGLKDELRDLDSLSEHGPDHGRGADMMGLSASRAQQLLSRGGPAVVKSEILSSPSSSQLGTTRSGTAAAAKASAAAAAAAAAAETGSEAAAATTSSGGYATNHYASGAAYHGRHTGPYATAAEAATGGVKAEVGSAPPTVQTRPHGSSAAAIAAAAAAAGGGDSASAGGAYGRDGAAAAAAGGATPTHHVARGRPVVSGMGIMVGGGPRIGVSGGADGGEKKFVGAYSPEARRQRIERFLQKREKRVWTKMVKYDVRKNFADTRMRVKGRFVKKEDEALLREVMACA